MSEIEGRLEVNDTGDGLVGKWVHDPNHGPWQATAPGWAVREFARIMQQVSEGKWGGDHPVRPLLEGHLVHTLGLWEDGEQLLPAERSVYYEATVRWNDGELRPLLLWRDAGFGS